MVEQLSIALAHNIWLMLLLETHLQVDFDAVSNATSPSVGNLEMTRAGPYLGMSDEQNTKAEQAPWAQTADTPSGETQTQGSGSTEPGSADPWASSADHVGTAVMGSGGAAPEQAAPEQAAPEQEQAEQDLPTITIPLGPDDATEMGFDVAQADFRASPEEIAAAKQAMLNRQLGSGPMPRSLSIDDPAARPPQTINVDNSSKTTEDADLNAFAPAGPPAHVARVLDGAMADIALSDIGPIETPAARKTLPLPSAPAASAQFVPQNASYLAVQTPLLQRAMDLGEIARGGFGSIHLISDKTLLRGVAMKILDPRQAESGDAVARFVEEAMITGQLDHPNIVPVHEVGIDHLGNHYFTMKIVKGKTLTELLRDRDFWGTGDRDAIDEILKILIKVCDALSFAHSRGVIHRDLKPDNIMVGSYGQVYLMDWGISRLIAPQADMSESQRADFVRLPEGAMTGNDAEGTILGSPAYMPPEQALGEVSKLDARSDIFCLGAILYEFLTGNAPYDRGDPVTAIRAAQACDFKRIEDVRGKDGGELPPELARICGRATSENPELRYQNVEALKRDLEGFLRGGWWFPTKRFLRGQVILNEGDEGDEAYIITSGQAEAYVMERGKKVALRTMAAGEVFGETAILTNQPRSASVRAVSPLTVMVVTKAVLQAEHASDSWMGAFIRTLATRFRELSKRMGAMRRAPRDHVVSLAILEHLNFHGVNTPDGKRRQCNWGKLYPKLQAQTGRDRDEMIEIIERHERLTLDGNTLFLNAPGVGAEGLDILPGLKPA